MAWGSAVATPPAPPSLSDYYTKCVDFVSPYAEYLPSAANCGYAALALVAFGVACDILRRLCFLKKNSFTDKHVLITGGSQGIGRATAAAMLKRGARVTLLTLRAKRAPSSSSAPLSPLFSSWATQPTARPSMPCEAWTRFATSSSGLASRVVSSGAENLKACVRKSKRKGRV